MFVDTAEGEMLSAAASGEGNDPDIKQLEMYIGGGGGSASSITTTTPSDATTDYNNTSSGASSNIRPSPPGVWNRYDALETAKLRSRKLIQTNRRRQFGMSAYDSAATLTSKICTGLPFNLSGPIGGEDLPARSPGFLPLQALHHGTYGVKA